MGLVLAFETSPRASARPPVKRSKPAQGADILFFTGVRYERERPAQAGQSTPDRARNEPTPAS